MSAQLTTHQFPHDILVRPTAEGVLGHKALLTRRHELDTETPESERLASPTHGTNLLGASRHAAVQFIAVYIRLGRSFEGAGPVPHLRVDPPVLRASFARFLPTLLVCPDCGRIVPT